MLCRRASIIDNDGRGDSNKHAKIESELLESSSTSALPALAGGCVEESINIETESELSELEDSIMLEKDESAPGDLMECDDSDEAQNSPPPVEFLTTHLSNHKHHANMGSIPTILLGNLELLDIQAQLPNKMNTIAERLPTTIKEFYSQGLGYLLVCETPF